MQRQSAVRVPRVWVRACKDIVCAYLAEDVARFVKPLLREPSFFELAGLDEHLQDRRARIRRSVRRCIEAARKLYRDADHHGIECSHGRCRHYAILAVASEKAVKKATWDKHGVFALLDAQERANHLFAVSKKIINEYLDSRS
jgi:hypothetical protein